MGSKNGYTIENGYIEAFDKKYKILFINKDVDKINQYCIDHNNCGVIDTIDNVHYVCSYDEAKYNT